MSVVQGDPRRPEQAQRQRVEINRALVADVRPAQPDNGDVLRYRSNGRPAGYGSFTKGLPHDPRTGAVDPQAFERFLAALGGRSGSVLRGLETLPDRGAGDATRPWTNPVAGQAFSTNAGDPQQYVQPPAPALSGAVEALEIVENYWMALLRDVPFGRYGEDPVAARAAQELTRLHEAAKREQGRPDPLVAVAADGRVSPATLFRGLTPADQTGPWQSQFLLLPVPFGAQGFEQRNRTLLPGNDFVTEWAEWVAVQNGTPRGLERRHYDPTPRYVRTGRDLAQWVHVDVLFQAYFNAALILLQGPDAPSSVGGGLGAPRAAGNPYRGLHRQAGFATMGDPGVIGLLCEVASRALVAVWYQKWFVHLRLRPEAMGGRVEFQAARGGRGPGLYPVHPSVLESEAIDRTRRAHGSALLPQAFPEGSPMHPAYGAGHATVAGACVTVLKAMFDGTTPIAAPVEVAVDPGTGDEQLRPYRGGVLTVGGELDKLASNVAIGRNIAGVHWRSDATASLRLGEQVATDFLRAHAATLPEFGDGEAVFTFRRFDGSTEVVHKGLRRPGVPAQGRPHHAPLA